MTYEEYVRERMKAFQSYDYVVMSKNLYIVRLCSRDKESLLDAMEKSMFNKEDSGEFLIRSEDGDNFNLRMFSKPEEGLSSIEVCCTSEVSQVMRIHIDDILKGKKEITLEKIFHEAVEHFINCKVEKRFSFNN